MLDPTMVVAASGSHLRLYDTAWSEQVVACSRVARRPCESNRWMLEKDGSPRQGCVLRIRLARFARQRSPCLDLVTNRNRLASQLLVPSLTKADNGNLAHDRLAPQASSVRRGAIWRHNGRPALFAFLRLALSSEETSPHIVSVLCDRPDEA
jgi:hypothetical protein